MTTQIIFSKPRFIKSFFFVCSVFTFPGLYAQSYDSLNLLEGHKAQVYYSSGAEIKARRMADQLDRVINFYTENFEFTPSVSVLILSKNDWNNYSKSVVYGMPHYTDKKTLIVAAENNSFWNSFIPPLEKLSKELAKLISETYSDKNGGVTMEPFFDLLAIHELGHAYHKQGGLFMQRNWMSEVFVNIFLHSYVAEKEPNLLPALTIFPQMVVSNTNTADLKYTSLKDLEAFYNEIAQKYPQNYGWYQCRWHMEAGKIYDTGGLEIIKKLWSALKDQKSSLDDSALATLLSEKVHQSVADVLLKWETSK